MGLRPGTGGLTAVLQVPGGQRRSYVTPSGAASLLSCKLRVAYQSELGGHRSAGSPATRLGTACHEVLERTARGELGSPDDGAWRLRFEEAWSAAVGRQEGQVAQLGLPRPWPAPERWPFYSRRKVATRRVVSALSAEVHAPGFEGFAEGEQRSRDGLIRGKPDLVVRKPVREVRDYKTGQVTGEDGTARPEYRLQVQLYAALEEASTGVWPERGVLVPLPGEPVAVDVEPQTAQSAASDSAAALAAYNEAVGAGEADRLGSPSPGACRYCAFAPHCPAFWEQWDPSWGEQGLQAVAGTVREVRSALQGPVSVEVEAEAGCASEGRFTVHEIDPLAHPGIETRTRGEGVVFVGLRLVSPGHARPGAGFRASWAGASEGAA